MPVPLKNEKLKQNKMTAKPNFFPKAPSAQTDSLAHTNQKAQGHSGPCEVQDTNVIYNLYPTT